MSAAQADERKVRFAASHCDKGVDKLVMYFTSMKPSGCVDKANMVLVAHTWPGSIGRRVRVHCVVPPAERVKASSILAFP